MGVLFSLQQEQASLLLLVMHFTSPALIVYHCAITHVVPQAISQLVVQAYCMYVHGGVDETLLQQKVQQKVFFYFFE